MKTVKKHMKIVKNCEYGKNRSRQNSMKIVKNSEWEKNPSRQNSMKIVKKLYEIISFIQDRKNKINVSFFKIFFFILYVKTGNDKH